MSVQLAKKDVSVSLAKGLSNVLVGLGWDTVKVNGFNVDLDASVFLVGRDNKVTNDSDFVFYNNLEHPSGAVKHTGDNQTGFGDGDDESILIDLNKIPANIEKLVITVTIHDCYVRDQNFAQVSNAFIRLVNEDTGVEELRFDLTENFSVETSLVVAEIFRNGRTWSFVGRGEGSTGDLLSLCNRYGVIVD